MANICEFDANLRGKKKDVEKFIKYLQAKYDYTDKKNPKCTLKIDEQEIPCEHHIGNGVWNVSTSDSLDEYKPNDIVTVAIYGDCAWSVSGSIVDIDTTGRKFALSLPQACKKLNVQIELYSKEPGEGFAEHYFIDAEGEIIKQDCDELEIIYLDDLRDEYSSYDEYVKHCTKPYLPITKEQFENENYDIFEICPFFNKDGYFEFDYIF